MCKNIFLKSAKKGISYHLFYNIIVKVTNVDTLLLKQKKLSVWDITGFFFRVTRALRFRLSDESDKIIKHIWKKNYAHLLDLLIKMSALMAVKCNSLSLMLYVIPDMRQKIISIMLKVSVNKEEEILYSCFVIMYCCNLIGWIRHIYLS